MASGDNLSGAALALAITPRMATEVGDSDGSAVSTTETVVDQVTFNGVSGYTYRLRYVFHYQGSVANDRFLVRIRFGSTTAGGQISYGTAIIFAAATVLSPVIVEAEYTAPSTGSLTFSTTVQRSSGTGTITPRGAGTQPRLFSADYVSGA